MIKAESLVKRYGRTLAVDGVSLQIAPGEVFGLLGENGAGKTTLIRLFSTLSLPDSGSCRVGGFDAIAEPMGVKRLIGVVFQESNLDRDLSARANLMFHARLHRLERPAAAVDATLDRLGLLARAKNSVAALLGGMRRRLVIGRAFLTQPRLLFLDEPTTGLDPTIRREILGSDQGNPGLGMHHRADHPLRRRGGSALRPAGDHGNGRLAAVGSPADLAGGGKLEDKVVLIGSGRRA